MRATSVVYYMAHPVGAASAAERRGNLDRARIWYRWLFEHVADFRAGRIVLAAPWLADLEALPLRDDDPAERAEGLRRQMAVLERTDGIVMVGARISSGMLAEAEFAWACGLRVIDMTGRLLPPPSPGMFVDWTSTAARFDWKPPARAARPISGAEELLAPAVAPPELLALYDAPSPASVPLMPSNPPIACAKCGRAILGDYALAEGGRLFCGACP